MVLCEKGCGENVPVAGLLRHLHKVLVVSDVLADFTFCYFLSLRVGDIVNGCDRARLNTADCRGWWGEKDPEIPVTKWAIFSQRTRNIYIYILF